jgi:hypothetical protein
MWFVLLASIALAAQVTPSPHLCCDPRDFARIKETQPKSPGWTFLSGRLSVSSFDETDCVAATASPGSGVAKSKQPNGICGYGEAVRTSLGDRRIPDMGNR